MDEQNFNGEVGVVAGRDFIQTGNVIHMSGTATKSKPLVYPQRSKPDELDHLDSRYLRGLNKSQLLELLVTLSAASAQTRKTNRTDDCTSCRAAIKSLHQINLENAEMIASYKLKQMLHEAAALKDRAVSDYKKRELRLLAELDAQRQRTMLWVCNMACLMGALGLVLGAWFF